MSIYVKRILVIVLLYSLFPLLQSTAEAPSRYEGEGSAVLPGHLIFKLREGLHGVQKDEKGLPLLLSGIFNQKALDGPYRLFPDHRAPAVKYHPSGRPFADLSRIYEVVTGSDRSANELIREIASTGMVEYVQKRYLPELMNFTYEVPDMHYPDDPLLPDQYYLESIEAFSAWAISRGDTNTVIGIVDTGVSLTHPDLAEAIKYNYNDPVNGEDSDGDGYVDNFYGWDLGEGNNDPSFNNSAHGLHVSGIAAATPDNGIGIAGVGYHSKFLPVKVDDEFGRLVRAYEGIVYAADQGASVINCSWGSHFNPGPFASDIIDYAVLNQDALVVAAAGNSGNDDPFYPASLENVLSVAAVDSLDSKTGFSSYGPYVDLTAPGVRMLSTWVNDTYLFSGGTSMAAPVVAGAAAILRSFFPEMDAMQIAALMKITADSTDEVEDNGEYRGQLGYGRINLFRSLTEDHRPYITVCEYLQPEDEFLSLRPGQQLDLSFRMKNLLSSSGILRAVLETDCELTEVLSDTLFIGPLSTYETFDNTEDPFIISVSGDIPANHDVVFTLRFYDSDNRLAGRQSFSRILNADYVNIDAGPISTTISSRGAIGFNYPDYSQGRGLIYRNGYTAVSCAGILIANSVFEVADNIYGADSASFSNSLHPLTLPVISYDNPIAPVKVSGSLSDLSESGKRPLGIVVNYNAYFWNDDVPEDFFIIDYDIINESAVEFGSLYIGFFADWVLRDNKQHRAAIDVATRLAYSYSEEGGNYAGLQLLNHMPLRHYAFDNQGSGGSIRINNGFTDFKKFTALTSNRMQAGSYKEDNSISSLIGSGPHILAPGDTLSLAFAVQLAEDLETMTGNTFRAADYYSMIEDKPLEATLTYPDDIVIYPNPFNDVFTIDIGRGISVEHLLRVFDIQGRLVKSSRLIPDQGGRYIIGLNGAGSQSGLYLLKISGPQVNASEMIIKRK